MSSNIITGDVCRPSHSILLDNFFRRMFQKPRKIVGEYIQNGDTVIDLGCGPGFFSIDMAEMAGSRGKLYAVDLQNEMLDKVKKKAEAKGLTHRICFHNHRIPLALMNMLKRILSWRIIWCMKSRTAGNY